MNGARLLVFSALVTTAPVPQRDSAVAAELKRATQVLLSAVAPDNWFVWEKYLDESMLYTAEDGRTLANCSSETRTAA